jgi:hypothetical protein
VASVEVYRAADVDDRGHYWGLLREDMTGRPALLAYATAARWLSHTRFLRLIHPQPAVTMVQLCRPDAVVDVVWTDAPHAATVRVDAPARTGYLVRSTGASAPIRAEGGAFQLRVAAAPPPGASTAPLGDPVLLVVPMPAGRPAPPPGSGC